MSFKTEEARQKEQERFAKEGTMPTEENCGDDAKIHGSNNHKKNGGFFNLNG